MTIVVALAVAYAPVLHVYAFSDDWPVLDEAQRGGHRIRDLMIAGGRPVTAMIVAAGFEAAGDVAGLAALRAFGVAGIIALGVAVARELSRNGWRRPDALLIALFIAGLPPMRLYASWTVAFPFSWAALLAGVAARLASGATQLDCAGARVRYAAASALLALAFMTYQPAATFYWVFAGIGLVAIPAGRAARAAKLLVVYAISAALGLLAAKVGSRLFPLLPYERTSLTDDPVGKARWFVTGPGVDALNLGSLDHSPGVAIAVAALLIAGLLVDFKRSALGRRAWVPVLVCALLVLSFSPNLAARESWTAFRTEVGLAATAAVLVAFAVRGLTNVLPRHGPSCLRAALACGAVGSLLAANHTVRTFMVVPQATELQWLRAAVRIHGADSTTRVVVAPGDWTAPGAPAVHYDEFGLSSFATTWAPAPAVAVAFRERGIAPPPVELLERGAPLPPREPGTMLLDARTLSALHR